MGYRIECYCEHNKDWRGACSSFILLHYMNKHLKFPDWQKIRNHENYQNSDGSIRFYFTKKGWDRIGKKMVALAKENSLQFRIVKTRAKKSIIPVDDVQFVKPVKLKRVKERITLAMLGTI